MIKVEGGGNLQSASYEDEMRREREREREKEREREGEKKCFATVL